MAFNEILRGCENPIEGIKGLRAQSDLLRQKLPAKSIPETVREEGFEHQVFDLPENPERLLKATKPGRYGIHPYFVFAVDEWDGKGYLQTEYRHAYPVEYLQRLELCNEIWMTDYNLLGFSSDNSIVTDQRFYSGEHPPQREVNQFLRDLGFDQLDRNAWNWFNEEAGVFLGDTKDHNFIKSESGAITPIDIVVLQPDGSDLVNLKAARKYDQPFLD